MHAFLNLLYINQLIGTITSLCECPYQHLLKIIKILSEIQDNSFIKDQSFTHTESLYEEISI